MTAGYVYVLASPEGHRKVGYTKNLSRRVETIAPSLPWPVELELSYWHPLARKVEGKLHRILGDARQTGEWFKCSLGRICQAIPMAALASRSPAFYTFVGGWGEWEDQPITPAIGLLGKGVDEIDRIKDEARQYIRAHGYIKVAAAAGLGSKNTLRCADDPSWNPTADTLKKLIDVMRDDDGPRT